MTDLTFLRRALEQIKPYTRPLGFLLLLVVTAYGLNGFFKGDWKMVVEIWRGKGLLMAAAFGLSALDFVLESLCWIWVYRRLGVKGDKGTSILIYMVGFAGILIPAQMGRLLRPDAVSRLRCGSFTDGVRAEAVLLFLDTTSSFTVVVALAALWVHPLACPLAALTVAGTMLLFADRVTALLSKTPVALPPGFWWQKGVLACLAVLVVGWTVNGMALYILVSDLVEGLQAVEVVFFTSLARVLGGGTGLPGGLGVVETILGVSLKILEIPRAHLVVAIGAYRLVTFWVLLPVGWAALMAVNRRRARG